MEECCMLRGWSAIVSYVASMTEEDEGGGGGAPEWGREDVGFFRRACEYVERMGWEGTVALPEFQRVKRYLRGIGEEGGGGIEGGEGVRGGVCEDENGGI